MNYADAAARLRKAAEARAALRTWADAHGASAQCDMMIAWPGSALALRRRGTERPLDVQWLRVGAQETQVAAGHTA